MNIFIFKWCSRRKLLFILATFLVEICALGGNDESLEMPPIKVQITGQVSDHAGPLPGVNVSVKGTDVGVITDVEGSFVIAVNNPNDCTLVFQYLGYEKQEVLIGDRRVFRITLKETAQAIDEVTIVAFGKQKKESVVGSITTISPKDLKRPTSNLTQTLAGNIAGIIGYQTSGEPGKDNANFFVRGVTSFAPDASNPLILIDGIELTSTDLARLQPDDIESFSVMKDATATALYGARGANGVILVTTKQGKVGSAKINVRVENSFSMPTKDIEIADPITYMRMYNEAIQTRYRGGSVSALETIYSQEKIDNTIAGIDPIYYPCVDWQKTLLRDFTMNQRANLSVSGGGGVARYYVSASINHDNGMFKVDKRNNFNNNINNNSYTLRSNVNIDVTKTTEFIVRLSGVFDDYSGPVNGGADLYNKILHANPVLFQPYYEPDEEHVYVKHTMFGNSDQGQYNNPYAQMVSGYKNLSRSQMQATVELHQNFGFLIPGLSGRAMFNVSREAQFSVSRAFTPFYYETTLRDPQTGEYGYDLINENGTEYLGYGEGDKVTKSTYYFEGALNYNRTFAEKHGISGMLVFTARNMLQANTGSLQLSLPHRNVSLSGRATYSWSNRYFGEFNFGYNASERFHKSHRWGFFPSVGAAWMVSNEKFWEPLKPVFSKLKLRYSWGKVGNDQIGSASDRFFYMSEVNMNNDGRGMTFGEKFNYRLPGISVNRYANPDIGWEVSTKNNYAIEMGIWDDRLNIIAEYFTEYRDNILMGRASIPSTMGLSAGVQANLGAASSKGVDVSLEYQQSFDNNFWASARANYTFARSKYEVFEEPTYKYEWRYRTGRYINQRYGYIAERLFIDDEEVANSPRQELGNEIVRGGDIKYTDINGDGVINGDDIVPFESTSMPEVVYGFGFSLGYKNFDLSAFFQGQTNVAFNIDASSTTPFNNQTQLLQVYADSHWSEDNQNVYALYPRFSTYVHPNNAVGSTWWERDGTFLRLKTLEFGYTLPKKWALQKKLRIDNCRFYVNGMNLLLFSKFKLWDVEMGGSGIGYPLQRVFNIGLNITFN